MEVNNVEIKFDGNLNEIDLDLLIEALVSYSNVTQEASNYITPTSTINIKIKATEKGSFKIILDIVAKNTLGLFNHNNISSVSEIINIVGGLYKLKQWISKNGKPEKVRPQEDGLTIEVTNSNGSITIQNTVYNIYQENPKVRESIRNTFTKLKEKDEITNFTITNIRTNEKIFDATKEDFEGLASPLDELPQRKQTVIKNSQELSIFKVVFSEKYKWEFYYLGTKIYASLEDQFFYKKIETGEIAFRSGDKLTVNIEIEQIFNESANTFVNDKYKITKVLEHIPRTAPVQYSLGIEE